MLAFLVSLFRRSPESGPQQIARARRQLAEPDRPTEATVGRPQFRDHDEWRDPKAVIPLRTPGPAEPPAPLTFDVAGNRLAEFCETLTGDPEGIESVEGSTVPVEWKGGIPIPTWREAEPETEVIV